jgi:hypothetical protein
MQPTANHRIRRVRIEDRLRFGTSSPIGHSSPSTPGCGLGSTRTSTRLATVVGVASWQRLLCQAPRPRRRHRNRVPRPMACRRRRHRPDRHKQAHDTLFHRPDQRQQRHRTGLAQPQRRSARRRRRRQRGRGRRYRHWDLVHIRRPLGRVPRWRRWDLAQCRRPWDQYWRCHRAGRLLFPSRMPATERQSQSRQRARPE